MVVVLTALNIIIIFVHSKSRIALLSIAPFYMRIFMALFSSRIILNLRGVPGTQMGNLSVWINFDIADETHLPSSHQPSDLDSTHNLELGDMEMVTLFDRRQMNGLTGVHASPS